MPAIMTETVQVGSREVDVALWQAESGNLSVMVSRHVPAEFADGVKVSRFKEADFRAMLALAECPIPEVLVKALGKVQALCDQGNAARKAR